MRILAALLALAVVFLFIGTSHALQISPTSFPIPSNSLSYYNITFYNNGNTSLNLTIIVSTVQAEYAQIFSNIGVKPASFTLAPGESKNILFSFRTTNFTSSLPIPINLTYIENGVQKSFVLNVPILANQRLAYISDVASPASAYPYSPIKFNLSAINNAGQAGIIIPVKYTLFLNGNVVFNSSTRLTLQNLGLNTFSASIGVKRSTAPGGYTFQVSTNYNGFSGVNRSMTILPFVSSTSSKSSKMNIFGGTASFTIFNNGNVPLSGRNLTYNVGKFNSIFITSSSASVGNVKVSGSSLVSSLALLPPGASLTLSYSVSYLPIYLVVLVVIAALIIFIYLNRKIVVSKEVVEHMVSAGIVDVKIALKVRNVSKKQLRDLVLVDTLPANALKISTVGPKEGKVSKSLRGMSVTWREADLSQSDEMLFMYEIKSKIGLVGSINLGPAECQFKMDNKVFKKKSNSLILNIR